jgi:hypothetical protein
MKKLALSRGHWSIENRSRYVRDMVYDEDRHQLRKGKGPHMVACLRNFAISLLRLMHFSNIAKSTREFAAGSHLALRLLRLSTGLSPTVSTNESRFFVRNICYFGRLETVWINICKKISLLIPVTHFFPSAFNFDVPLIE